MAKWFERIRSLFFSDLFMDVAVVASVTWSAALQIAWNKRKPLTCEKSSIPTRCFLYTNMAAESLFCTQIWPPLRHVKTIYWNVRAMRTHLILLFHFWRKNSWDI